VEFTHYYRKRNLLGEEKTVEKNELFWQSFTRNKVN